MKKLNSQQLRTIRVFVIVVGILISFFIWLSWPDVINNNALYHVGNGKYGSKMGALLILLIPLFGFCPSGLNEEIHSTDQIERAKLQERLDKRAETIRLYVAFFCSIVACLVMLGGLFLLE